MSIWQNVKNTWNCPFGSGIVTNAGPGPWFVVGNCWQSLLVFSVCPDSLIQIVSCTRGLTQ